MDISTRTVTTRVHNAIATAEDLKGVAILAVKGKLGLADAAVQSAKATAGEDGAISVEVVELVADAPSAPSLNSAGAGDAGSPQIPGAGAPQIPGQPTA